MAASQSYRDFVLEQLGRVTPVAAKSMFGGVGIYAQGLFFALIAEGRLYFKVNDATRPEPGLFSIKCNKGTENGGAGTSPKLDA